MDLIIGNKEALQLDLLSKVPFTQKWKPTNLNQEKNK